MVHLLQPSFQLSSLGRIRLVWAAALMLTFQTLSAATEVAWTSTSSWRGRSANGVVVSEQVKFIARSQLECAILCQRNSDCPDFVFDTSTSTCHVLQQFSSNRESSLATVVFSRTDVTCSEGNAPNANGTVTDWMSTLTSLTGSVECDADYINVTEQVLVRCDRAQDVWSVEGRCSQRVWRNPPASSFPLPVPMPTVSGWSVCVEGVPVKGQSREFEVSLVSSQQNMNALRAVARSSYFCLILSEADQQGNYLPDELKYCNVFVGPFPFQIGTPFNMRLLDAGGGMFKWYNNGTLLLSRTTSALRPPAYVIAVYPKNEVVLTKVNTWCP